MKHKYLLGGAICACSFGASSSSDAALINGDLLLFDPSVVICTIGGTPPLCDSGATDVTGSYWSMDINDNGTVDSFEKFLISMNEGIKIGVAQPASGSHAGMPDGSETPGIDNPWSFKANTGMHQTLSPITEVSPGLLDFSGWGMTWNGIPNIALGGDQVNFPKDTGLATIVCSSSSCSRGDTYVLDYVGHVPENDISGFGGISYSLHLEGVVSAVPLPPSVWLFSSGIIGLIGFLRRR